MHNQQVHEVVPVVSSNNMLPTAPILPPNNPVHKNPQVGLRQQHFRNVQEAKKWIDRVKIPPHVDPDTDATINAVDANRQAWVEAMIDAVYDLQHCQDSAQMKAHFTPTHKSCFQDIEVEAACHVLADALVEHCRLGFRGLDKFNVLNNTVARNPVDETTNCYDRANNILTALRTWKSICKGIVEEADKKWQLVNAPLSTIKKKNTEASANTRKKVNAVAGKNARQQVMAIKQSGRASIASPSLGTSAKLSHANTPDSFGVYQLQQAPSPQNTTISSAPHGLGSVSRAIARPTAGFFGRPTIGRSQTASTMRLGLEIVPHDNAVTATEPIDRPSQAGYQSNSSTLGDLGVVSDEQIADDVELRDEHLNEGFDGTNPFTGLSKLSYDPHLDAEALFAGGLDGFGASCSSFGPTGDAFQMFEVDSPLRVYPAGLPSSDFLAMPSLLPPAYEQQSPFQDAPPYGAPQSTCVPPRAQTPFMPSNSLTSPCPSASAMNQNYGENVQHSPNSSDFGNTSNTSSHNHYNATHQSIDQRTYYLGPGGLAAPVIPTPVFSRTSSSMSNAQPRNDTHVNRAQDVSVASNTQAAQTSNQAPQPIMHSNYTNVGSKRAREEQMNEAPLPQSRRTKRNDTGAYYSDDTCPSINTEDQVVSSHGDSESSGNLGPMAGDREAGNGDRGASLDEDML
jgi:hypothetical protein